MHARVSTFEGPADQIEAGMEAMRAEIMPQIEQLEGFKGVLFLGDRTSGKSVAITLWESEEAMESSREAANRVRQAAADAESATIRSVDEFEVLMDERR